MRKKQRVLNAVNKVVRPLGVRVEFASTYRTATAVPLDAGVDLSCLRDALTPRIEMAILGSIGDRFTIPSNLGAHVRIFSLDAIAPADGAAADQNIVSVRDVIAPRAGPLKFIERVATGVSSYLEPRQDMIDLYGLQRFYIPKQEHDVEAITLSDLAGRHGVPGWDYIRTDLEGADHAIVRSLGDAVRGASLVEMELRTEPFYRDEPYLHEVLSYMFQHGFEVLDLKPERWRAKTANMLYDTRGRVAFTNTVFVNRAKEGGSPKEVLRHALVLGMMGYANFAERVLEPLARSHAEQVRTLGRLFYGQASSTYLPFSAMPQMTHGTGD